MALKNRPSWAELELRDKLGYIWAISFGIVVVSTAAVIIVPIVLGWLEEYGGEEEEEGDVMLRRPAVEYRLAACPEVNLHDLCADAPGSLPVSPPLG